MNNRKKIVLILLILLVFVIISIAQSYSLFTYSKKGETKNSVTMGTYVSPVEMEIRTYLVDGKMYADVNTYSSAAEMDYVTGNNSKKNLPNSLADKKIHVIPYAESTWYTDTSDYKTMFSEYGEVTIDANVTAEYLKNNGYDIVIVAYPYWTLRDIANQVFNSGIDIVTIGDDTGKLEVPLDIISTSINDYSTVNGKINPSVDNIITRKLSSLKNSETGTGRWQINFIDEVEVWYQENLDGNIFDTIGYYNKNGVQWIHSQYHFGSPSTKYSEFISEAVDFIAKKNVATFEITSNGDYTFTAVDKLGNKSSETIYIDTTAPTKPTFSSKTSSKETVSLTVTAEDAESKISKITCYYGDSSTNITSKGTLSGTTCTYPSTASYAKVCVQNEFGLESCSDPKQLAIYFIKDGVMLKDFSIYSSYTTYTNEDGYVNLVLKSGDRTGIYTTNTYDTSNYQYAYVDSSWNLTANDNTAQPSLLLGFIENGLWFDRNGTKWKEISLFWKNAGDYETNITTERTLYAGSIPTNTYSNTTIVLGKNSSSVNFNANIYNVWFQLGI